MGKDKKQVEQSVVNVNVSAPSKSEGNVIGKYFSPFKEALNFLSDVPVLKAIKVIVFVAVSLFLIISFRFAYNAVNNDEFINMIVQKIESTKNEQEKIHLDIRTDKVTPKIQRELAMLCYSLNADRAFIFELHNGKRNASGLPFRYADMSYEETNEEKNVESVAMQFQDIPLTLYKYPHYLAEHRYIYSNVSEFAEIDNGFAKHVERIGGQYLGMMYLTTRGLPLGFLCVSFHGEPQISENVIRSKIEQYGKIITPLLDLSAQLKEK